MTELKLSDAHVSFPIQNREKGQRRGLMAFVKGSVQSNDMFHALKNVSITLNDGDRLAIMGHNGAGKTTILNMLSGILAPDSGVISIKGRMISILKKTGGLLMGASCRENIKMCGYSYGLKGKALQAYVNDVLSVSQLEKFADVAFSKLSQGMQGRMVVSCLLPIKPEILVVDEWIGASDRWSTESGSSLLGTLVASTKIFVLATHREKILKTHCNRAIVMEQGRIILDGSVDKALQLLHERK